MPAIIIIKTTIAATGAPTSVEKYHIYNISFRIDIKPLPSAMGMTTPLSN